MGAMGQGAIEPSGHSNGCRIKHPAINPYAELEVVKLTDQGELITVQAAADRLAVSRWMIYRLIWDQQLKSVQIGRCRRVIRQSLDDYVAGLIDGVA
jgi:excisionase family DNA binding protein